MTDLWNEPWFPTAITVLVILGGGVLVWLVLRGLLVAAARRFSIAPRTLRPAKRGLKWVVLGSTVAIAASTLGWNMEGVWTFLSTLFALVAIGFIAVWSVLSNMVCALLIRLQKPFQVGDTVGFPDEGVAGLVTELALTFTTLQTEDGTLFRVPNNLFFQKSIACRLAER